MFTGTLTADLLLGDVHSLKGKRAVVKPIVAELRRRFSVAAAEVGDQRAHHRALLLQRPDVAQQQVEHERPDVHGAASSSSRGHGIPP